MKNLLTFLVMLLAVSALGQKSVNTNGAQHIWDTKTFHGNIVLADGAVVTNQPGYVQIIRGGQALPPFSSLESATSNSRPFDVLNAYNLINISNTAYLTNVTLNGFGCTFLGWNTNQFQIVICDSATLNNVVLSNMVPIFNQYGIGFDNAAFGHPPVRYAVLNNCEVYGGADCLYFKNTNAFVVRINGGRIDSQWDTIVMSGTNGAVYADGLWSRVHDLTPIAASSLRGVLNSGCNFFAQNCLLEVFGSTNTSSTSSAAFTSSGTFASNNISSTVFNVNGPGTNVVGANLSSQSSHTFTADIFNTDIADTNLNGAFGIKQNNGTTVFLHNCLIFPKGTNQQFQLTATGTTQIRVSGIHNIATNRLTGAGSQSKVFSDQPSVGLPNPAGALPSVYATNYFIQSGGQQIPVPITQAGTTNATALSLLAVGFKYTMPSTNYTANGTANGAALPGFFITGKTTTGFTMNFTLYTGLIDWTATLQTQ